MRVAPAIDWNARGQSLYRFSIIFTYAGCAGQDTIIHSPTPLWCLTNSVNEGGGVRLIAVGCTIDQLTTKVFGSKVMKETASILSPLQLAAARLYVNNFRSNRPILKSEVGL